MEYEFFNALTEEEKDMPVTFGQLAIILGKLTGQIVDVTNEQYEMIGTLSDHMDEYVRILNYKRIRDLRFLMEAIRTYHYLDKDKFYEAYEQWCVEFDELNKQKEADNETKS